MATQPDIVLVDKQRKEAVVIDCNPKWCNISKNDHEKLKKYQGMREELEKM